MIQIDGSFGEGGGQILRTSLTLALMTGTSFEIKNIRANRKRPGLMTQHLKSVEAAKLICNGNVRGAEMKSTNLVFEPGTVAPGDYSINIQTAGSTSLVFQTIYLPLTLCYSESKITITGGTHVPWSPCFHYLKNQWQPALEKIGFKMKFTLDRAGFYPQGQGRIRITISPIEKIQPISLTERGSLIKIAGISAVANLDKSVAERQQRQAQRRLEKAGFETEIKIEAMPAKYKNTMCMIQPIYEKCSGCFTALGAIGKRAEKVAEEAVAKAIDYLNSNGCVDKYLADQLILPLAFAKGKSEYTTTEITEHLRTNIEVMKKFLDIEIRVEKDSDSCGRITIVN